MRTVAAVIALVACVHAGLWALDARSSRALPAFEGQLASVSYAPFQGNAQSRCRRRRRTAEQIRADLKLLAPLTRAIRTYSSTGGVELVPGIAAEFGLRVTVGAWIDKHKDRNEREIRSVIDLAHRHSNINGIFVGNETIYRGDETVPDLITKIQRVKRAVNVPVTTGEIWNVWIEHPELVSAVDYIAAHILPYWEGFAGQAGGRPGDPDLRQAARRPIPASASSSPNSAGRARATISRTPSRDASSRRWCCANSSTRAEAYGIDYNIVEAIDQPWKIFEGGVGPYWGLFDASRQPKFSWTGPITNPDHWKLAGIALAAERAAVAADLGDEPR